MPLQEQDSVTLAYKMKQAENETAPVEWRFLAALLSTLAGAVWLRTQGSMPVVRGTMPLDLEVPFVYMLSAFPFLGVLTADVFVLLRSPASRKAAFLLAAQVGVIILLSAARLSYRLPISGHILLLTFFVQRSMSRRSHTAYTIETGLGLLALAVLIGIKLVAWRDWVTVGWAMAVAIVLSLSGVGARHILGIAVRE
ncbi:MAG: hypothetical protein M5U01_02085 [Ardenticatenaceae bacterium]|nr:hypothetical protein [Ardenticatenaceae bacterium]